METLNGREIFGVIIDDLMNGKADVIIEHEYTDWLMDMIHEDEWFRNSFITQYDYDTNKYRIFLDYSDYRESEWSEKYEIDFRLAGNLNNEIQMNVWW